MPLDDFFRLLVDFLGSGLVGGGRSVGGGCLVGSGQSGGDEHSQGDEDLGKIILGQFNGGCNPAEFIE